MDKRAKIKEREYLRDVAEAIVANRPLPLHPTKRGQIAIENAGGVAAWIRESATRLRQFDNCTVFLTRTKHGKTQIPLKHGIEQWPRSLRPSVKGYRQPDSKGGDSIKPSPLSAGMPGNEETDPGYQP
jgi:hypothetical protein